MPALERGNEMQVGERIIDHDTCNRCARAIGAENFNRRTVKNPVVKTALVNGLTTAMVSTAAVLVSEALNSLLEYRGMDQRRVSVMMAPNPFKR